MPIRKILLADDDADDREIFERVLGAKEGMLLINSVENGREVINYLDGVAEGDDLPDLIILDHNMPKLNGTETLELLKSSDAYADIKVVIYSTYSDERLTQKCLGLGAEMILTKPSSMKEYEAVIEQFLQIIG